MVLKAVLFTHNEEEFEDEYDLRDWLGQDLERYRRGGYHLREPSGLGKLEEGSLVFFNKTITLLTLQLSRKG